MLADLRAFLLRGNVLDLAVAVIIGTAFGTIVTAFVNVVLALVGALFAVPDFSAGVLTLNGANIPVGALVAAVVNFMLVGTALFAVVKVASRLQRTRLEVPVPDSDEVLVLREIRDALRSGRDGGPGS